MKVLVACEFSGIVVESDCATSSGIGTEAGARQPRGVREVRPATERVGQLGDAAHSGPT